MTSAIIQDGDDWGFLDQPIDRTTKSKSTFKFAVKSVSNIRRATFSEILISALERTDRETSEGLKKIQAFIKFKQELLANMSEEERDTSKSQFMMLDEYLTESRLK